MTFRRSFRRAVRLAGFSAALAVLAGCGHSKPSTADVLNVEAKLPADMPVPALDWRTVTSSVDRAHGTMAMLTANDKAIFYAGSGNYPAGSVLALTTWLQRDDPHWFGARIPGTLVSLETVTMEATADGKVTATYKRYAGNPLRDVTDNSSAESRKAAIVAMRYAPMP